MYIFIDTAAHFIRNKHFEPSCLNVYVHRKINNINKSFIYSFIVKILRE